MTNPPPPPASAMGLVAYWRELANSAGPGLLPQTAAIATRTCAIELEVACAITPYESDAIKIFARAELDCCGPHVTITRELHDTLRALIARVTGETP